MGVHEILPDGRHRHHIGTVRPSLGLLDIFRSMVVSPQVIVGNPFSEASLYIESICYSLLTESSKTDYINLPFQPEQRVQRQVTQVPTYAGANRSEPTSVQTLARRNSSSTTLSCYTVKSRRQHSSDKDPNSRRHSDTTTSILSSMCHTNILYAIDLKPDSTVQMSHIHLGAVIHQAGKQSSREADCYIMQLISGLSYLHSIHITHRNICPSNLLLTNSGVLKIANFTSSELLKPSNSFRSSKRCGTMPYIAPEVFIEKTFDGKAVDIWAVGVVYMEMRCGKVLWEMAAEGADEAYDAYLRERAGLWGFRPVENLKSVGFRYRLSAGSRCTDLFRRTVEISFEICWIRVRVGGGLRRRFRDHGGMRRLNFVLQHLVREQRSLENLYRNNWHRIKKSL